MPVPGWKRDCLRASTGPRSRTRNLGDRQEAAIREALRRGPGPVIVIGTDSPTLPVERICTALALSAGTRRTSCCGPTEDGGYYLLGLIEWTPGLFNGVMWSAETVCDAVIAHAGEMGLRSRRLARWNDVDLPDDLLRLAHELKDPLSPRDVAPATWEWIDEHAHLFGPGGTLRGG